MTRAKFGLTERHKHLRTRVISYLTTGICLLWLVETKHTSALRVVVDVCMVLIAITSTAAAVDAALQLRSGGIGLRSAMRLIAHLALLGLAGFAVVTQLT